MDREDWDRRYLEKELVWSAEPNRFLVEEVGVRRRPVETEGRVVEALDCLVRARVAR